VNAPPRRTSGAAGRRILQLLRLPRLVIGELALVAMAGAAAVVLPQEPNGDSIARFVESWPVTSRLTATLGLHRITTSWWFVVGVVAALASLLAVQLEQWRRVVRQWRAPVDRTALAGAQFRRELDARTVQEPSGAFPLLETTGRHGSIGSPLFHLGLVLVVAAGLWRALTFSEAAVRAIEGLAVDATPEAWDTGRAGALGRPFATEEPVRLISLRPEWYPSGALQQLEARVAAGTNPAVPLAINRPLGVRGGTIYLTQAWGVAPLVELVTPAGAQRTVVYLEANEQLARGTLGLAGGLEARFKARVGSERPDRVEVRVVRGRTLVAVEELGIGGTLEVGDVAIRLAGLPYWAQYRGSRDPSEGLFLAGVAVAVIGITLMMAVVRVDSAVFVEGGRLVVALRAQRFAPLYAERFERLCRELTR
jgi:cytochrome c biogenesis protein ResB